MLRHVAIAWLLKISNLTLIIYLSISLTAHFMIHRTELGTISLLLVSCQGHLA